MLKSHIVLRMVHPKKLSQVEAWTLVGSDDLAGAADKKEYILRIAFLLSWAIRVDDCLSMGIG